MRKDESVGKEMRKERGKRKLLERMLGKRFRNVGREMVKELKRMIYFF